MILHLPGGAKRQVIVYFAAANGATLPQSDVLGGR